jgi:hypothetical protein
MERSIWIGWDPREADAFAVASYSAAKTATQPIPVIGLMQESLREEGLYRRPQERRGHQLWDLVSDAPMATEFACSRFLVPYLVRHQPIKAKRTRWAVFMDCDMLVRTSMARLFEACDPTKAVMVVKHNHHPSGGLKMDGQIQTRYHRKNWSSVMVFNVDHPANDWLDVENVNKTPGRDLHAFCWLRDDLIGELTASWNYLVGHTDPEIDPDIVHFTDGIPTMAGYEDCEYADEWRQVRRQWVMGGRAI